jgi:hypothetical protein
MGSEGPEIRGRGCTIVFIGAAPYKVFALYRDIKGAECTGAHKDRASKPIYLQIATTTNSFIMQFSNDRMTWTTLTPPKQSYPTQPWIAVGNSFWASPYARMTQIA